MIAYVTDFLNPFIPKFLPGKKNLMSNVNVKRVVENIRENTTIYTALIEAIVNSIQAIDEKNTKKGKISVRIIRSQQQSIKGSLSDIVGFDIEDDGIGFTDDHREAFDTLYTDYKIKSGGKGFGRFICLKYFDEIKIQSNYLQNNECKKRSFTMGSSKNIIVDEEISESNDFSSGTIVKLRKIKNPKNIDKKISTISRILTEKIFPYFIDNNYACPTIIVSEIDGSDHIILNEYNNNELSTQIQEIACNNNTFSLKSFSSEEHFSVRIFKIFSPGNHKSRISLVAHQREVTQTPIDKYVPEFSDEFVEKCDGNNNQILKNYIIVAYTMGTYLNNQVSLERCDFKFSKKNDIIIGISQEEIEKESSAIAKNALGEEILGRQEKKRKCVYTYVDDQAPWHKQFLNEIDLSDLPFRPSVEEIESKLQREKFTQELETRKKVKILLESENPNDLKEKTQQIVSTITSTSQNDLIHYIAQRKIIIDIFDKSLQTDENGLYSSEGAVHDIIFPRKNNSESTNFEKHNLWILDERLNFTNFISSDEPLDKGNSNRPDLIVFDKMVVFRGDNEASNPVTIFEFKKPYRDDFVNPSSKEDPVQQLIRYVNEIREGNYKTPKGRAIHISDNTPFYGYVVCDLSKKVKTWLDKEKDFKPMPDQMGWFKWRENINLYIEVLSWEKLLKDAQARNQIFFHKLGI